MNRDIAAGKALSGGDNGRSCSTCSRRGGLAGTAFPDADVDIITVYDRDEYYIASFGEYCVGLHNASDITPVQAEIINENAGDGIADIDCRECVSPAVDIDLFVDNAVAFKA